MKYRIAVFKTFWGKKPFDEWLKSLNEYYSARVEARIERLELGLLGDVKKIGGTEIYEARLHFGPGFRIYFGIVKNDLIILLLTGGDKSTQRTDIKKAQEFWENYMDANYGKK